MPQNPILIVQTPTLVFGDLGATFLSGEGWSGFSVGAMDFRVLSLELSQSDLGRFEMRGSASGSGGLGGLGFQVLQGGCARRSMGFNNLAY